MMAALTALMASPAMAEVCSAVRPGWSPGDGAVSVLGEAVRFLLWGGGAVLIAAVAAGIYWRKSIVLNAVLLLAVVMAVPYLWPLDPVTRGLAVAEGCVGPATGAIALLGLIWVAALVGLTLKRKEGR
ncbi:MAG: hypothetical protein ACRC6I_22545 [Paracoccaceae bacterium]